MSWQARGGSPIQYRRGLYVCMYRCFEKGGRAVVVGYDLVGLLVSNYGRVIFSHGAIQG